MSEVTASLPPEEVIHTCSASESAEEQKVLSEYTFLLLLLWNIFSPRLSAVHSRFFFILTVGAGM